MLSPLLLLPLRKLSATYSWPNQSHASLGPSCSVADVKSDGSRNHLEFIPGHARHPPNAGAQFSIDPARIRVIFADWRRLLRQQRQ